MENDVFFKWLIDQKGLTDKSARDVISRTKRANKYIDLSKKIDVDEILFKLSQNQEFHKLGISIKSQLRRAIKLLKEFEKMYG